MATPRHSEQNWTGYLYNKPLEYTQLVLSGEIEHYLSWLRPWQTGRLTFFHRNVIGCYRMALQKALQKIRKLF